MADLWIQHDASSRSSPRGTVCSAPEPALTASGFGATWPDTTPAARLAWSISSGVPSYGAAMAQAVLIRKNPMNASSGTQRGALGAVVMVGASSVRGALDVQRPGG